jgi:hypothetical protein
MIFFCQAVSLPAHGQVSTRGGQGRRIGRVALPTPPFNPNAGILNVPKTRRSTSSQATARRASKRSAGNRNPLPGTPRKRRVRRGRQSR